MCWYHCLITEYYPCRSEGIPCGDSRQAPVFSTVVYALQILSTTNEWRTSLVRARATLRLWSVRRRWAAHVSISRKYPLDIQWGLGVQVNVCVWGVGGIPSAFRDWNLVLTRFRGPVYVVDSRGRSGVLTGTPCDSGKVASLALPGRKSGRKWSSGGTKCLPSHTAVGPTPVLNYSETAVIYHDGPVTTSGGENSGGVDGNGPEDPSTWRTPGSQKPVDNGGYLGGRCLH